MKGAAAKGNIGCCCVEFLDEGAGGGAAGEQYCMLLCVIEQNKGEL